MISGLKYYIFLVLFLNLAFVFAEAGLFAKTDTDFKKIGYFSYWSFKNGYSFSEIPTQRLTHIIYSSLTMDANGECVLYSKTPQDHEQTVKILEQFKVLKTKNPKLKVMFSIGSLSDAGKFSDFSISTKSREKLVTSCVKILSAYNFDGVDVDWEYPVHAINPKHGRPVDRLNFVLLLDEFRRQMGNEKILSIATTAYQNHFADLDIKNLSKTVDWFGVMAYDFCMSNSKISCHHSLLNSSNLTRNSADRAIDWYLKNGATKQQIILGVPFYGYTWKVDSLANNGIGQKNINSQVKEYDGFIRYFEIKQKSSEYNYFWDESAQQPWLFNDRKNQVISFDDQKSIKLKLEYIKKNELGGVMIWEIPYDNTDHDLLKSLEN